MIVVIRIVVIRSASGSKLIVGLILTEKGVQHKRIYAF